VKLGKKIRYIILPVIILASTIVTGVYYSIYKAQLIENKIYSLNEYLKNTVTKTEYDLAYAQSYLQHKIDSKEASLIFTQNEQGKQLSAPYISQFLEQFVNKKINANNALNVINDFILYDGNGELVVHINTKDPFIEPTLRSPTKNLLLDIKQHPDKKISQYYYFIDDSEARLFNIIQVFSPYQLTSQPYYNSNDELYIVQAQIGLNLIRVSIDKLLSEYDGYITSTIIMPTENLVNNVSINLTPFAVSNNNGYQAIIDTELFKMIITLDKAYFAADLNTVLVRLIFLSFILIGASYLVVVRLIDTQIILPVTKLAKSIKEVEASLVVELTPLHTDDEVSDLNESYISLIRKINNLANNDALTGLSNRGSFNESLSSYFDINKKNNRHRYAALFFIDLDNFKYVNDTCGHKIGDQLLVAFSQRLKAMLAENESAILNKQIKSIARLGGDEFVILIDEFHSIAAIESIGTRICSLFSESFNIGKNHFNIHASVGIAYTNGDIQDGETLLNQADSAMYVAKKLGKNNYKLFTSDIADKENNELNIENQLIETLNNNQFVLVFMPAYTAQCLTLKGYEVLLRCPSLTSKGTGPDIFIPIAEKTDLILKIDLWVAENAFIKLKELTEKTGFKGFFAINVSSKSLRNDDFFIRLKTLIKQYDIDVKQIELEITETCLMPDDHQAIKSLNQLKSLGVSIAIDDFGTGYTSFNQLVNYPLDTLKIDRSFVQSIEETPVGKKPTLDIIYELAKIYELEVIIEGIETEADLKHVQKLPNAIVQGFYFTTPCQWDAVINECNKSS
jgi:diguanylate cyclase (GGDEF)-like protein